MTLLVAITLQKIVSFSYRVSVSFYSRIFDVYFFMSLGFKVRGSHRHLEKYTACWPTLPDYTANLVH